ncbi:MAG TPA: hypothetical protein PLB01_02225 [Thermoanaerobaculia bacterium]|nr:hypothetical protein [Thermoanaerobaculia bacterium]
MRFCLVAAAVVVLTTPARSQNLVADPSFRQGLGAWSDVYVIGAYTMTWVPSPSVRPGSGSALLSFDAPARGAWSVCVPVQGGLQYDYGFSIYYPDAARTIGLNEAYGVYSGPGCTGTDLGGYVLPIVPAQLNTWITRAPYRFTTPPAAQSVIITFMALGVGGAKATAYVDDIYLGQAGTIPPIDPPPAIPSLATPGLLALGAALALAAARILRA